MSSESECEFFDASDITPSKMTSSENTCHSKIESKNLPIVSLLQKSEHPSVKEKLALQDFQFTSPRVHHQTTPWRSRTTSPLPDLSPPSLSNKLASSLPTLHLEESVPLHPIPSSCAQSLLMTLGKPFAKEDEPRPATLMPPPKDLPLKLDIPISSKGDPEETSSACSTSLLDTLGAVEEEDDTHAQLQWRRRRARQRKAKSKKREDEEESGPPSPGESRSSSVDALFPTNQTSAPFRVVEVDATSVYSTTFSQKEGMKGTVKIEEKVENVVYSDKTAPEKQPIKELPPLSKDEEAASKGIVQLSPEPDVVASTKSNSLPRNDMAVSPLVVEPSSLTSTVETKKTSAPTCLLSSPKIFVEPLEPPAPPAPVAPPRRNKKRRRKDDDANSADLQDTASLSSMTSLPAPSFSMAFKDADVISHHLDLHAASKGEYIVSPLDTERSRAPRPSEVDLARIESAGDTTSQASTPEITRAVLSTRLAPADAHSKPPSAPNSSSTSPNTPSTESVSSVGICGEGDAGKTQALASAKSESPSLTDEEILRQVSVLNLDTGESIPLSEAEDYLPEALNPLSLHMMRLASEYISSKTDQDNEEESDEESIADVVVTKLPEINALVVKKRTSQLKKIFGKTVESAVNKAKTLAQEVSHKRKEEKDVFEDDAPAQNTMQYVKIKTSHGHKGPHEFDNLMYVQELKGEHTGPVWSMKFSPCGRLLATAGQDHVLRVWVLKQAFNYFLDIRTKWNADMKSSPTPSQESLVSQHSSQHSSHSSEDLGTLDPADDGYAPFMPKPFCVYSGHTADVLDLSWSKNYFMLTSSMDKTVRLWHISRKECLCIFKHVDFVTAIAFHPKDDRYFISGSLDGKLRLWSIPDKQVVMWNEVEGPPKLITAANFCQNGTFIVVGTYNGRCIFFKTEELKYFTQIHVKSTRGKNARGRKITGIEPLPEKDMLLITSNDSRIRLYDLNVLTVSCKYKGYSNVSSQIRAGFSHDGKYIIAGSENQCIYIWKTHHDYSKFSSARKDRNTYWEGVKAHSAVVTCAIFCPRPDHVFNFIEQQEAQNKQKNSKTRQEPSGNPSATSNGSTAQETTSTSNKGYVLVSADFNGCIKVFLQKEKPKHSSLPASALA